MGLYIDNLERYSDYIVHVMPGKDGVSRGMSDLSGLILNDSMSLSLTADIQQAAGTDLENASKGGLKTAVGKIPVAGDYLSHKIDENFNSLVQTAQEWRGSTKFSFDIKFAVFLNGANKVGSTDTYADLLLSLAKYTQTRSSAVDPKQETFLYDYVEYNKAILLNDLASLESKLITVRIGKWFKCRYLLCSGISMELTTHVDNKGQPIYAIVSASFETYRALNAYEWASILDINSK